MTSISRLCILLMAGVLTGTGTRALGQTITAKLSVNPIVQIEELVPLAAGLAVEVGVTPHSALQLSGSYRHFRNQDEEPDTGSKFYLDYRYYVQPAQTNDGLFISPFIGAGSLRLGTGDDLNSTVRRTRYEQEAGVLLGYQAVFSRFTLEGFAGPAYRRQTTSGLYPDTDYFIWLRAGFTAGLRLRK
ncbi:DUF3575 domain-containing protein [Hymenobacter sp. 102]|uniref:DUF3575 domain-containing protein n=1 Tax=Hymenobacter sp. 102 TaxID=3403152 RepID=UPI003CEDF7B0